jgi:hypothetical protein
MRAAGRALTLDEVAIAQALSLLRQRATDLPPVLWDAPDPSVSTPTALETATAAVRDHIPNHPESATPLPDAEERKRRIVDAMTRRRQALMDAERAGVPVVDAGARMKVDQPTLVKREDVPADTAAPASRRAVLFRETRDTGDASVPFAPAFVSRPRLLHPPSPPDAPQIRPSDPAPMQEPENGWPIGPAPLGRVAMADLMSRVVAAPSIVGGQASEQGVTKNRLAEVLIGVPRAQARELAEILLVWFDAAGLLVEPARVGRLRHPRPLITTNLPEIALRLNATPCPDKSEVAALWTASSEGRY